MRFRFAFVLWAACAAFAQTKTAWDPVEFLVGEWTGEGSGEPGKGNGGFTFSWDLQRTVLMRRNFAEYPAQEGKPAFRHDDLTVIYKDPAGALQADYYDNEGHVIRYAVSEVSPGVVQFLSAGPGPRYRLTYSKSGERGVGIKFEVAPPGKPFGKYIEASAHRK